MRILLVEDDLMIGQAVYEGLQQQAYAVDWVKDGEAALLALSTHEYDVGVFDIGLPKKNGLQVLAALRGQRSSLPVLLLTARDTVDDRITGLDTGADDYLVKPFEMKELLARIRAISRRRQGNAEPILDNGVLKLNPATKEVQRDDKTTRLSSREFALLLALMQQAGTILSRSDLEERIYGWNEEVESNAIEFLIHSLRKKLGSDSIKNVRGLGWFVAKA
ncbi:MULTISPECIES: response regulator [Vitreoscilla]|uniref:Response regulator transcription factor n=1 Tax=Vitreoscilla stercoraria TaxID=61 RepID=A0ABY4E7M1_VITST|nr:MULTISPECIES: response regulator transcription factor [Vitreoscilla]AUZ04525.1 signal transduction response regulator [Vitreoscilla sp. C1]UOO91764.1 response regulator transcription factor [Vitreoscilla stercoraria]